MPDQEEASEQTKDTLERLMFPDWPVNTLWCHGKYDGSGWREGSLDYPGKETA